MDRLRQALEKADRIPRGSFEEADKKAGVPKGTIEKQIRSRLLSSHKTGEFWRHCAVHNFDDVLAVVKAEGKQKRPKKKDEDSDNLFRTCTVPLNSVLRPDLDENLKSIFMHTVESTSVQMTDCLCRTSHFLHEAIFDEFKEYVGRISLQ
ncbi:hypothetical protein EC973_001968 [Apophysomyces ossiformis]|uniref:Uncharacterized protein n=1 Tax=Apophysomyces ossiformis TaxID=679940 RepID=A0A8H7BXV6_9FUNG|nr:hypothetical protein EC973_001968 [Apophysomyces ossiformis]